MWLLPLIHRLSSFAAHSYYRLEVAGELVPGTGPLLLVANHPNSLHDPAMVAAVAGRPIQFLAKEPLFHDPGVGWLIRGSGSIPIYRAQDDPASVGRNEEAFRAVHQALRDGAAIGIFPEGISHHLPALAPLKTGAARIALGAAKLRGGTFPIVPIGISLRGKEKFRSEALAQVGPPVPWDDLAKSEFGSAEVRELTRRIGAGLEALTVNLASWEDAPLIESAAAIYSAHFGTPRDAVGRVTAEREATRILNEERQHGPDRLQPLAREVRRHARVLRFLGLEPRDVATPPGPGTALRWTLRQAAVLGLTGVFGMVGSVLFYLPYRLTGIVVARMDLTPDVRSTYRTLGGAFFFSLWILLLVLAIGWLAGGWAALAALLLLPLLAIVSKLFRDRWTYVSSTARRFLLLRHRRELRSELFTRQRSIAERLRGLRERLRSLDHPTATP
jgi:glycerol-3-phosphate O-acyltransferase / dihydroxyacetone phosphate acyltransferase